MLRIFDENLELVRIIDDFINLNWETCLEDFGSFDFTLFLNEKALKNIRIGFFIENTDDLSEIAIINSILIDDEKIKVAGKMAKYCFNDRVTTSKLTYNNKKIVDIYKELIGQLQGQRALPFSYNFLNDNQTITADFEPQEFSKIFFDLTKKSSIGFRIFKNNKSLVFELFKGTDRSIEQTQVPRLIVSYKQNNLLKSEYLESNMQEKNVIFAKKENKFLTTNLSGLKRKEMIVDEESRAGEELGKYVFVKNFENEISNDLKVGLGDTITCSNFGINLNTKILKIQHTYSRGVYKVKLFI